MNKYELAMRITTQEEADASFEELVADSMVAHGLDRQKAEQVERVNLGYRAGYYQPEIRVRVEELFHCEHPVLGKAKDFEWTSDELHGIGFALGKLLTEDGP